MKHIENIIIRHADTKPATFDGGEPIRLSWVLRWAIERLKPFNEDAAGIRSSTRIDAAIRGSVTDTAHAAYLSLEDEDHARLKAALEKPAPLGAGPDEPVYPLAPARLMVQVLDAIAAAKSELPAVVEPSAQQPS